MTLKETIENDMRGAVKAGEKVRTSLLRFLLAEIHNQEIAKQTHGILGDEDTLLLLRREAKKREEAAGLFREGSREDLAVKEEEEIVLINAYLPPLASDDEIEELIERLIASGLKDFPSVIKEAMKAFKGRADGKRVGDIIRKRLPGA